MFFYVDESGHTGANLFDEAQPKLYYGLLSSDVNLDYVAEPHLVPLRKKVETDRLHAAQLGNGGLVLIADGLIDLQRRFKLRFDFYRVAKPDHAVICFFDQVFDQGMNPAITWTGYWTPLRSCCSSSWRLCSTKTLQGVRGTLVSIWKTQLPTVI